MVTTWRHSTACYCPLQRSLRPRSSSPLPVLMLLKVTKSDKTSPYLPPISPTAWCLLNSSLTLERVFEYTGEHTHTHNHERDPSSRVITGCCCTAGDPIGGCAVTSAGFAAMAAMLASVAPLAIILEGGTPSDQSSKTFLSQLRASLRKTRFLCHLLPGLEAQRHTPVSCC